MVEIGYLNGFHTDAINTLNYFNKEKVYENILGIRHAIVKKYNANDKVLKEKNKEIKTLNDKIKYLEEENENLNENVNNLKDTIKEIKKLIN